MSEGPWIRFFPSNWLGGTRGLSAAETGVYITLVAMMYERGDPIPNEPTRLARLCGTTPASFRTIVNFLIENDKIEERDEGLWNRKVEEEMENRREKSQQARDSAERRWRKRKGKQEPPDADAMRTQSDSNASYNHSNTPSSLRSDGERARTNPSIVLQSVVDAMTAQTFVSHCEDKRRSLSIPQAEAIAAVLRDVRDRGGSPADALRFAIKRGWVSLEMEYLINNGFPLKPVPQQEDWPKRMQVWRESRTWAAAWGPKPDEPRCRVPAELLKDAA